MKSKIFTLLDVAFLGLLVAPRICAFSPLKRTTVSSPTRLHSYLDSLSGLGTPSPVNFFADDDTTTTSAVSSTGFQHIPVLSLDQADVISSAAVRICQRNGFNPVTVIVLDQSGSPIVSKRMDGCSPVGVTDFAMAKAYSCIVNKYPSRAFRDRYTAEPNQAAKFCQMTAMVDISQGKMAPFPGGILLTTADGQIVGAVGVSGAAGDEDEYCAIQGVREANVAGLFTVPETHSCATVKDPQ
mmetsp:Transcript_15403/g.22735  ORF Transcript_15403/g.22735 Transcript_15403/m.22735 type:complete len:241 (-) Transcript_15403:403-1125(-)